MRRPLLRPRRSQPPRLIAGFALAIALVPVTLSLSERTAAAEATEKEKEAARALAQLGYDLFQAGKYEEALTKLEQAEEIYHAPPHLELQGRALEKLGRLLEARARYERVAAEPPGPRSPKVFRDTHAAAVKELDDIKKRIPTLQVRVTGAPESKVTFSIDGKPVPGAELLSRREMNPGAYTLRLEAPDVSPETRALTLGEGSHQELEIALKSAVAAPAPVASEPQRGPLAPGLVVLGVGAAGLVVGGITGALSLGQVSDLKRACPDKQCPAGQAGTIDSAKTLATVSTVGFVAGGALAVAGAALLVVRPSFGGKSATGLRVRPVIGVGQAGIEGVF